MANLFLLADPHFSQQSMCHFTTAEGDKLRPFQSAEEMDEVLVSKWNGVVRQQDKVYLLGDVTMRKENLSILSRLNGHKRLVHGNHDIFDTKEYMKYFESIYGVRVLDDMILSHIPLHGDSITKRYNTNVHGHLHSHKVMRTEPNGDKVVDSRYFCVSVEQIDFTPIALEDLRIQIKLNKEKYPPVYTCYQKGAD